MFATLLIAASLVAQTAAPQSFNPRSAEGLPPCANYPALNPSPNDNPPEKLVQILPGPNHACWFHAANGSGGYVLSPYGVNRIGN
jgi:hypothetical protein